MCYARLRGLLENTPKNILEECDRIFKEQEHLEIIEEAPYGSRHIIHYLPHKPVIRSEKVRPVFDGSAGKKGGHSLNDQLHAGPPLTKNLAGILLNFWLYPVGVSADIEKAFLQVGLDEADCDAVRFLWVKDINKPPTKDNVKVYRFLRTPFGVNASPFLLNMVLLEHFGIGTNTWWKKIGRECFYVDNLVAVSYTHLTLPTIYSV